jgi:cell wall-associated NlpC family hydrolase
VANRTATAIGVAGLGVLILWSGVTNSGIFVTIQSLIKGTQPTPGPPQSIVTPTGTATGASYVTGGNGTASGSVISNTAMKYDRQPYIWGGAEPTPPLGNGKGFDCYGLLTFTLHHDLGYNLPNNTHSGYLEFLAWGGATKVTAPQAGDLIIWPTHAGIAVSSTEMISAMNPNRGTGVDTFQGGGPLMPEPMTILRVNAAPMIA